MAKRTIFVSDFTSNEITDEKEAVTITLRYEDGRRGIVIADAHISGPIVEQITKVGRQQQKRGRPRKNA